MKLLPFFYSRHFFPRKTLLSFLESIASSPAKHCFFQAKTCPPLQGYIPGC